MTNSENVDVKVEQSSKKVYSTDPFVATYQNVLTDEECKHFIVGDGCSIGLNFTNHVDIAIILDTSESINQHEFSMLSTSLSGAIESTFPKSGDVRTALTM